MLCVVVCCLLMLKDGLLMSACVSDGEGGGGKRHLYCSELRESLWHKPKSSLLIGSILQCEDL